MTAEEFVNEKLSKRKYRRSPYPIHRQWLIEWLDEYAEAKAGQHEPIVIDLKTKIEGLYVNKIENSELTKDEADLARAVHNDAITMVLTVIETEKIWEELDDFEVDDPLQ